MEALLLLLMAMTFLLLRRIVRRSYARSYKLNSEGKPGHKVYERASGNHQASRSKRQVQMPNTPMRGYWKKPNRSQLNRSKGRQHLLRSSSESPGPETTGFSSLPQEPPWSCHSPGFFFCPQAGVLRCLCRMGDCNNRDRRLYGSVRHPANMYR